MIAEEIVRKCGHLESTDADMRADGWGVRGVVREQAGLSIQRWGSAIVGPLF